MTPILSPNTLAFVTHSTAQTERIGARLANLLRPGDVVCLEGDLGAGKTCLTRGIGRGLGITKPVTSPTFVLIGEYLIPEKDYRLYHIDLYRLDSLEEAWALGLDEYLYGAGISVIEWAEKARELLPEERLWITLEHVDENKRSLTFEAAGDRYLELLARLQRQAFGVADD